MSTLLVKTAGPENIGKVIAIVTTPMIFGPIFGPVLGGLLIEFSSWQWLFFINVGVVALATPYSSEICQISQRLMPHVN
jgi:MFS family permease